MPFRRVQRSKCLEFGKMRGKNSFVPFYWTFLPFFRCTTRIPLFTRISPAKLSPGYGPDDERENEKADSPKLAYNLEKIT